MNFIIKIAHICTFISFIVIVFELPHHLQAKTPHKNVINDIVDIKDFKKLLRTKNNVLTLFIKSVKQNSNIIKVFEETAEIIKGQGTMILIDCTSESKKLCKKLKVDTESYIIKHFKDGEFYKNYDRKETVSSMLNFMRDPTGDIPWDEDSTASNIVHIADPSSLNKLLRKETGPIMIMFYAPWCGFCKQLKPEYTAAALELKGHSILAAIDVNKPENIVVRNKYNITGFPTLIYFENGVRKFNYEGENNKKSIVEFMKKPSATPFKPVETEWSSVENDVKHLTDETFDDIISETESILVMFYAPWCGHCKRLKPKYEKAAEKLKQKKINGILAALDATKEPKTAKKFSVTGYPTLKYFRSGEFQFDVNIREEDELISFIKDPKKPPPPPPPEKPWADEESEVVHLTEETFKTFLKKKKHAMVMFYAPWCGHCKKAKPEFVAAADIFKDDSKVAFAAVDCTSQAAVCSFYNVKGYPTIKVFNYLNKEPIQDYSGGRAEHDFTSFMKKLITHKQLPVTEKPASKIEKMQKELSMEKRNNAAEGNVDEEDWNKLENSDLILHLTDTNFDYSLKKHEFVLVYYYKNDCSECKLLKKEYSDVALMSLNRKLKVKLGAYNGSKYNKIATEEEIDTFPTIKFYSKGETAKKYSGRYKAGDIFNFLKSLHSKLKDEL